MKGTLNEVKALDNISLTIKDGSFTLKFLKFY